jgi:hypothetical protein
MSKDKKTSRLKSLIGTLFGIQEWKLNEEGHLDVTGEILTGITEKYGADFVHKFELLLGEESSSTLTNYNQNQTEMKELKLALICALLSVDALSADESGNVSMTEEQLGKIEAGLKDLQDAKAAADSNLTAANSEKDGAVTALSGAVSAMDDLDASVREAKDPAAKVEAIRTLLAKKPGTAATGAQGQTDARKKIEGADEVNEYINKII